MAYGDYTKENWKNKLRNNPEYKYVESKYQGKIYHYCYSDASCIGLYNDGCEYPWVVAYRDDSDKLYRLWFDWNPDKEARNSGDGADMVADWYRDVFDAEPITDDEDETVEWLNENL
jgi:hypothetical protein